MLPVLILKTGSTVPEVREKRGDFEDWIISRAKLDPAAVQVVHVQQGQLPQPIDRYRAVIVTGSSALVSEREDWSERSAAWLANAVHAQVPILGICYGHQLLAHALGGEVAYNPQGREIGSVEVQLTDQAQTDPLFQNLPRIITVQTTHVQSVHRLPEGAKSLAHNSQDPYQAFVHGNTSWGVQFHPEFDAEIVRGYLHARGEILITEGFDPVDLAKNTRDSEHGAHLLDRFARLFCLD